jgi:tRNA threonylcarbamoyl adenosine modification protein YjeE
MAVPGNYSFTVTLADEEATRRLMVDVAEALRPGDTVTLSGDLGAGKTSFARALIRHLAGDPAVEVPSPTFTLMQAYELPRFTLMHADFYRLSGPSELAELGFDDIAPEAVTLIEWPDRAAAALPTDRLDIAFSLLPLEGPTFRHARVTGHGSFAARVERMAAIRMFLSRSGFGATVRQFMQGDASTRAYERLTRDGESYILMNAPQRPDGPAVRDGKPYSAIAHLADNVTPFIAMTQALRARGFSAPAIFAADRSTGLVVIEDLGNELVVAGDPPAPIEERYEAAADLLAALHRQPMPDLLPVEAGVTHLLPRYDFDAFLIEAELLIDWYLPRLGVRLSGDKRDAYVELWHEALKPALAAPPVWVLRDFHSPNLLWLPQRRDVARVGLLDFQDAVLGPAAYDLASLAQDARVDVPELLEIGLLSRYIRARLKDDPVFDAPGFAQLYATMAAQRASKILGIFARLDKRDGKPQYLRHMPRVWTYLQRALAHPALAPLASWYRVNVPPLRSI